MPRARHVPERRCIACGQRSPKRLLTRIVRTPQGAVCADATGKASGRGAYLCGSIECWERGLTKGGLARSLQVSISPESQEILFDYYRDMVAGPTSVED